MKSLKFTLSALQPILEHARNAPETSPTFGDRLNAKLAKPNAVPDKYGFYKTEDIDADQMKPSIMLAKDRGVYIFSAGEPRQLIEEGSDQSVVAYAQGCDPRHDDDWYDTVIEICGGDDFGQRIEVSDIDALVDHAQHRLGKMPETLIINFISETDMSVTVE